eukprot:TRINITY_DN7871_c0_g1_i1.p1 TRINITY_DN7871_c0_g1~~TRINITY_DN7871_c0_g1_i1.p1  ORF type:complete len:600 (+),score=71.17 TRINITY_DN7871_c0_g1_i1:22-1800(+)
MHDPRRRTDLPVEEIRRLYFNSNLCLERSTKKRTQTSPVLAQIHPTITSLLTWDYVLSEADLLCKLGRVPVRRLVVADDGMSALVISRTEEDRDLLSKWGTHTFVFFGITVERLPAPPPREVHGSRAPRQTVASPAKEVTTPTTSSPSKRAAEAPDNESPSRALHDVAAQAAVNIQRCVRGFLARKRSARLKLHRRALRCEREQEEIVLQSCFEIQRLLRGASVRLRKKPMQRSSLRRDEKMAVEKLIRIEFNALRRREELDRRDLAANFQAEREEMKKRLNCPCEIQQSHMDCTLRIARQTPPDTVPVQGEMSPAKPQRLIFSPPKEAALPLPTETMVMLPEERTEVLPALPAVHRPNAFKVPQSGEEAEVEERLHLLALRALLRAERTIRLEIIQGEQIERVPLVNCKPSLHDNRIPWLVEQTTAVGNEESFQRRALSTDETMVWRELVSRLRDELRHARCKESLRESPVSFASSNTPRNRNEVRHWPRHFASPVLSNISSFGLSPVIEDNAQQCRAFLEAVTQPAAMKSRDDVEVMERFCEVQSFKKPRPPRQAWDGPSPPVASSPASFVRTFGSRTVVSDVMDVSSID